MAESWSNARLRIMEKIFFNVFSLGGVGRNEVRPQEEAPPSYFKYFAKKSASLSNGI